MRSGRHWMVALAGLIMFSAYGCSVPRHTDTLMFGTNSKFALDVSAGPDGNPSITVGYKRQEFVWLPLLVNGADSDLIQKKVTTQTQTAGDGSANKVSGIDMTASIASSNEPAGDVGKAKYTGTVGSAVDTYSVLASFGATFGGGIDSTGKSAKAEGGLSQYFATGLAARILADKGGEKIVSVQPQNSTTEEIKKLAFEQIKQDYKKIADLIGYVRDENNNVNEGNLKKLIQNTAIEKSFLENFPGKPVSKFEDALKDRYFEDVGMLWKRLQEIKNNP